MPRIALQTLVALQKALPGTILGPQDARPFLGAELHPVLNLPHPVIPGGPVAGISRGSVYFSQHVRRQNVAAGRVAFTNLDSGLWRISGDFTTITSSIVSILNYERLYFTQEGTATFFKIIARVSPQAMLVAFDFNVLLRDSAEIGIDFAIVGAGETVDSFLSLNCEKIL